MFEINYLFPNVKCLVHVKLGAELSYEELASIREEVQNKCPGCSQYIAVYDYAAKPTFSNFSLTPYRRMNAIKLDIVINIGMNQVQRSFARLVHSIKPSSNSIQFADTLEDAIALAKQLIPNLFINGDSASC